MLKRILTLAIIFSALAGASFAQNVNKEKFKYKYMQLPLQPFPAEVKTYSIMNNIGTLRYEMSRSYIENKINKACTLEGYSRVESGGDVEFLVTVGSFYISDYSMNTNTKSERVKQSDGTYKSVSVNYYQLQLEYNYPVHLNITNKITGEVIYDDYINGSQDHKIKRYKENKSWSAARKQYTDNPMAAKKTIMREAIDKNMAVMEAQIESNYDFATKSASSFWSTIEDSKKISYSDVQSAVENAKAAMLLFQVAKVQPADFTSKMEAVVGEFNNMINAAEPDNKKAKFNQKATLAIYRNAALANIFLNNFAAAKECVKRANEIKDPKGKKQAKWAATLTKSINYWESRYNANF